MKGMRYRVTAREKEMHRIAVEEVKAGRTLDNYCMGVEVGQSAESDKVRIKFLGLPGHCGPELNVDLSLALDLRDKLIALLSTTEEGQ